MPLARALPAFAVGFGIVYLISMDWHPLFTLFTYAPRIGQWFAGVPALQPRQAPGMYWFSWLTTGLIGGLVAAAVALVVPANLRARFPTALVWATPLVLVVILAYIERPWFGFK